jgi:tetratricopeptide (TPR) repeat protein
MSAFPRLPLRLLAAIFVLPALNSPAAVADPDVVFSRGNRAFETGDYAAAEAAYRELVEEKFVSPELFYNLGNTAYRQDRSGEAALWFRRALAIDPRFAEARQNLQVVKKKTGYHEFELKGIEAWLARLSSGELVAILSATAWIAVLTVAGAFLIRRLRDWRPLLFITAGLALAAAAVAAWGLIRQRESLDPDDLAIVTAPDAVALTGPVPDAEKVVDLPPGSELQIIQSAGPWTYVGIPQDIRGWVRTESLAPVIWYGERAGAEKTGESK